MANQYYTKFGILPAIAVISFLLVLTILGQICNAEHVLYSGENLSTGQSLQYGNYIFTMQQDCNLVLYDSYYPVWATNTGGLASNCYCAMQSDGNLVVYEPYGRPIWASNSGRNSGYYVLVLQKDRNVVIYGGAIWATGSNAVNMRQSFGAISITKLNSTNSNSSALHSL